MIVNGTRTTIWIKTLFLGTCLSARSGFQTLRLQVGVATGEKPPLKKGGGISVSLLRTRSPTSRPLRILPELPDTGLLLFPEDCWWGSSYLGASTPLSINPKLLGNLPLHLPEGASTQKPTSSSCDCFYTGLIWHQV